MVQKIAAATISIAGLKDGVLTGAATRPALIGLINDRRAVRLFASAEHGAPGPWRWDLKTVAPLHLLSDEMKIDLTLADDETNVLASMRIQAKDIAPWRESRAGKDAFEGYLDSLDNGRAQGWVWRAADPTRSQTLYAYVGERFAGAYLADRYRADLAALGKGEGRHGFDIDLAPFLDAAPNARVKIVTAEPYGWEPVSHAAPKKGLLSRLTERKPRLGVIGSPQELVAAIANTPPYPKKVYDIAQVARAKMPDAFAADYTILALEFARREAAELGERVAASTGEERARHEKNLAQVEYQLRRLTTLGEALAAGQKLMAAQATKDGR
jgi:hypothetical protein